MQTTNFYGDVLNATRCITTIELIALIAMLLGRIRMVTIVERTVYACPYCGDEFPCEDDCEWHIDDCQPKDSPDTRTAIYYKCDLCQKEFDDQQECYEHEDHHDDQEAIESQMRLRAAAQSIYQTRVTSFTND